MVREGKMRIILHLALSAHNESIRYQGVDCSKIAQIRAAIAAAVSELRTL
jgi:hypothetical protein